MYYQHNFSAHSSHCGTSDIPNTQAFNSNETNFGNAYFPVPPPPLPPFRSAGNGSTSLRNYPKHTTPDTEIASPSSNRLQLRSSTTFNTLVPGKSICQNINKFPHPHLNVTCIKKDLIKCVGLMKELERQLNLLKVFKRTLTDEDWSNRCGLIKSKEEEISNLLKKYEDVEYFLSVQRVVKRCTKKRAYRKRKKKEWQEIKQNMLAFREREHRRIDMWLEKMKDQAEKSRRQEQVQREADLVLSEVTAKKAEAKRFINLFNAMTKLRNARVQKLRSSGEFVSDSEINTFTEVIDKLKKLWIDHLKECNVEEQGLRVMLNDAEVERVNVETKVNKQIQNKWIDVFFGKSATKNSEFTLNLEELIAVRYDWDRFISSDTNCLSSKIPIGWIVPSDSSSTEWAKFLQS